MSSNKRNARIHSRKRKEPKLINTSALFQNPVKRKLYSFLLKPGLEKVLGVNKLNENYEASVAYMKEHNVTFMEGVFAVWGVDYQMPSEEELAPLREYDGPLVVVCNHPFGGLEAMFLMLLQHKIRPNEYKTMANFVLQIPEIKDHFIFVDPFENENSKQRNIGPLREVMGYLKDGGLLGIFPAGEVAAYDLKSKKVVEPDWNPSISKIIQRTKAAVLPVYFHGHNSMLFQMAGVIHARLRTTLLIREFVNQRSMKLQYALGDVITPDKLQHFKQPEEISAFLKQKTLMLQTHIEEKEKQRLKIIGQRRHKGVREQQPIAAPVDRAILRDEISRMPQNVVSNHKNFDVIIFDADEAPGLLMEIGREREIAFREVGEGTGKSIDLDKYDYYYHQIIVWDREAEKLVGGYRMGEVDTILREHGGMSGLYLTSLFNIDRKLFDEIGGSLELGRSFVTKDYQRNFYSLFLLWVGISQFIVKNPYYKNVLGPVSISNDYHTVSKNMLVNFLLEHHYDTDLTDYVRPKKAFERRLDYEREFYEPFQIKDLKGVHELISEIEKHDKGVPILIKHYLKMGSRILEFNVDPDFQNCLDALVLTDLTQTNAKMVQKYMGEEGYNTFMAYHEKKDG